LGANVRVDPASANSVISGQLDLGAGSVRIFDIRQGARLNVNGRISGGAGISLVKSNRGDLHLTSSNSFSGDMEIVGGTLTLAHGRALGATDGVTRLILGTLAVNGSIGIPETLVVPGPSGVLQANSGSASWLGSVVLEDHLDIIIPTNSFLTIGGQISGPAGWTKNGDGTLQFKTLYTNTYAGTGWVRQGKLIMDGVSHQPVISGPLVIGNDTDPADTTRVWPIKQNQIGDRIAVTINRSGLFQLGFLDAAVGSLGGSGHITLGSGNTLVVGKNDQSTTFSGVMDGPGNFHKIGAGTLTLTGTNAYTGTSALSAGTLVVNGSIASSAVLDLDLSIVPSNSVPAIVAGTGSVPRILLHGGGIVAPGSSLGRLTVQGELGLSNGVVRFELDGPTPGISCDQLRVNGAVQLGQSQLELSLGFSPDIGHTFMLIQNDGTDPVQGAFLGLPQGSHFSAGGMVFAIEYNGGADANDVVLTRVAAPLSGISSLTAQAEGIVLHGVGVPGCTYILEFAPYLNAPVSWTPIATNQATALGAYKLIDENPLDSQRYYRVRSP
jgi:autotransporter-associated beta strand protein